MLEFYNFSEEHVKKRFNIKYLIIILLSFTAHLFYAS